MNLKMKIDRIEYGKVNLGPSLTLPKLSGLLTKPRLRIRTTDMNLKSGPFFP